MCGFHCTCPICWSTDWKAPRKEELPQVITVETFKDLPLLPQSILGCLDAIKAL